MRVPLLQFELTGRVGYLGDHIALGRERQRNMSRVDLNRRNYSRDAVQQ